MNFDALDDPPNVAVRETPEGTPGGDGWESVEANGFTLNDLHDEIAPTLSDRGVGIPDHQLHRTPPNPGEPYASS